MYGYDYELSSVESNNNIDIQVLYPVVNADNSITYEILIDKYIWIPITPSGLTTNPSNLTLWVNRSQKTLKLNWNSDINKNYNIKVERYQENLSYNGAEGRGPFYGTSAIIGESLSNVFLDYPSNVKYVKVYLNVWKIYEYKYGLVWIYSKKSNICTNLP